MIYRLLKPLFVGLLLASCILYVKGQQSSEIRNQVVCRDQTNFQTTTNCGPDQIIEVQSATIAAVSAWSPCTADNIVPVIQNLPASCTRSQESDGAIVAERCQGEHVCTLTYGDVPRVTRSFSCGVLTTNVLWFTYTCVQVTMAADVLLPQSGEASGRIVQLFSPYYPCEMPSGTHEINCFVDVDSTSNQNLVKITAKLVEFRVTFNDREDRLWFQNANTPNPYIHYRSSYISAVEEWNEEHNLLVTSPANRVRIVSSKMQGAEGGKFWLQVEATDNRGRPTDVSIRCSGFESFPTNAASVCVPLTYPTNSLTSTTTSSSTTTTTPTTTSTTSTSTSTSTTTPTSTSTTSSTSTSTSRTTPASTSTSPSTTTGSTSTTTGFSSTSTDNALPPISDKSKDDSSGSDDYLLFGMIGGAAALILIATIAVVIFIIKFRKLKGKGKPEDITEDPYSSIPDNPYEAIPDLATKNLEFDKGKMEFVPPIPVSVVPFPPERGPKDLDALSNQKNYTEHEEERYSKPPELKHYESLKNKQINLTNHTVGNEYVAISKTVIP